MSDQHDIRTRNESQFRQIAIRVLKLAGFSDYVPEKKIIQPKLPQGLLEKDGNIYCLETFYSRREMYSSGAILTTAQCLIRHTKEKGWLPLIVVGGMLSTVLRGDLLGMSIRTVILDVENLLYMALENRELYDELVAQLPYSPAGLRHREPDFLPMPDWNAAYAGKDDYDITAVVLRPDSNGTVFTGTEPAPDIHGNIGADHWGDDPGGHLCAAEQSENEQIIGIADDEISDFFEEWDDGELVIHQPEHEREPDIALKPAPSGKDAKRKRYTHSLGNLASAGAVANILIAIKAKEEWEKTERLKNEIQNWKSSKRANAAAYEKLCTRTLMRLFADDLTLWNEQAKSNSNLYRFDLLCKIKSDNHKDFWEIAERYFNSKYIIFEFKNYTGKVTQKEVYTTVRYLYPTALRRVAIIISPNGIDDHADKAIRGALRDEGKLILSLTNEDLIEMLRMKEDGEDPADLLSDKLDALLIDLEK